MATWRWRVPSPSAGSSRRRACAGRTRRANLGDGAETAAVSGEGRDFTANPGPRRLTPNPSHFEWRGEHSVLTVQVSERRRLAGPDYLFPGPFPAREGERRAHVQTQRLVGRGLAPRRPATRRREEWVPEYPHLEARPDSASRTKKTRRLSCPRTPDGQALEQADQLMRGRQGDRIGCTNVVH